MMLSPTVAFLRTELAMGRTTSRGLVDQALARITDPSGEGSRAFLKVYADMARMEADTSDRLRAAGIVRSPIEGLPVSVKDLFDVGGDVTRAGSKALEFFRPAPAVSDAPVVARLRAAGAIIVGRTNTVEFAFGGIGLNPHYGTPQNPYGRGIDGGRVPGGSSCGAAVAVADGMCVMGLGSDTRGSIRIPAALCGVAGFKPTQSRVPRDGCFPLSYTLDSAGPLAPSLACCAVFDAILSGEGPPSSAAAPAVPPVSGLRLLQPKCFLLDGIDEVVSKGYERALTKLKEAGAIITTVDAPELTEAHKLYEGGGFAGPESAQVHREMFAEVRLPGEQSCHTLAISHAALAPLVDLI